MHTQSIQKLVEIINSKIFRELFSHRCFSKNILHQTDSTEFTTFLEENRLVNRREVLQNGDSFIGQFHSIRGSQFHWG